MPVTDGWLVGIAEINLPIEVKLANIERTELAKQAKMSQPARSSLGIELPSNFGANYQQHRRGVCSCSLRFECHDFVSLLV
jgi:hypothetical protein